MAGSRFFALFDDIATLLDDISVMSKVAAKKTASVLTDDLAVNAEKVVELKADRELPVVWAVCKGSLVNKAILVPLALALNYVSPVIVHGLLVIESSSNPPAPSLCRCPILVMQSNQLGEFAGRLLRILLT